MYSFFVLGLIPGTNFQITFQVWLDSLLLLIEVPCAAWLYRRYRYENDQYIPLGVLLACHYYYALGLQTVAQIKAFLMSQAASWNEKDWRFEV